MTNVWIWGPYLPKRGRMVVFKSLVHKKFFVKRLIGWPGDEIKMLGNQVVEINGVKIQRAFLENESLEDIKKGVFPKLGGGLESLYGKVGSKFKS